MDKMKGYEFKAHKNYIAIKVDGEFKKIPSDKIVIKPEDEGFVSVKRKWYRGHFKVVNSGNGLTVMNDIPIELYLQGVVPSEMPSSWEHDAHKAQAIAARKITASIAEALPKLDEKLMGFAAHDAVMTAPETRSSSPVRIIRGETRQSAVQGLYPTGEGAGYAGGIMSAAIDGMMTAEAILGVTYDR